MFQHTLGVAILCGPRSGSNIHKCMHLDFSYLRNMSLCVLRSIEYHGINKAAAVNDQVIHTDDAEADAEAEVDMEDAVEAVVEAAEETTMIQLIYPVYQPESISKTCHSKMRDGMNLHRNRNQQSGH